MNNGILRAAASLKALYYQTGAGRQDDEGAGEIDALEAAVLMQSPTSIEDAAAILDIVIDNMGFGPRADELDVQAASRVRDFLKAQPALGAERSAATAQR